MTASEIIATFETFAPQFPAEAVRAAIKQREEVIPGLLAILDRVIENPEPFTEDEDYMGHIFAAFLLSEFREPQAHTRLIKLFHLKGDFLESLWSDIITEEFPSFLAATSNGDPSHIIDLANDRTADDYVRLSAVQALVILYSTDKMTREALIECLRHLLKHDGETESPEILDSLVYTINEIHPIELLSDLEDLFEKNPIDEACLTINELRQQAKKSQGEVIALLRKNKYYSSQVNTMESLAEWPCFNPDIRTKKADSIDEEHQLKRAAFGDHYDEMEDELEEHEEHEEGSCCPSCDSHHSHPETPHRLSPMESIGRNDPCPCGSNKKFKKCCGSKSQLN